MYLHASNIFNIQKWLDEDDTTYHKVHVWKPARVAVGNPPSGLTTVTTLPLVRETVRLNADWMVDYAHAVESLEPVLFGKPITIEENKAKRYRRYDGQN